MTDKPFVCLECGKKLTRAQAQKAVHNGCPKCGGSDVDVSGGSAIRDPHGRV